MSRDFYTIQHPTYGKEEHAYSANAATNKAVRMLLRNPHYTKVDIIVDRGKGKTTSKVYHYATIEATNDGFVFKKGN